MNLHAMIQNRESRIRSLEPIRRLPRKYQDAVLDEAEVLEFGPGQTVYSDASDGDFVYFLLEGRLDLSWNGKTVRTIDASQEAAMSPVAPPGATQYAVRARGRAVVLRVPRAVLTRQAQLGSRVSDDRFEVQDLDAEESSDWVVRVLQSGLFSALPPSNLQKILVRMEDISAAAGDVILRQGDPGDYYFVLVEGIADVTRTGPGSGAETHLAELGPGSGFGEEALITGATRNATITMRTNGRLMRLHEVDFKSLVQGALIREVSATEGRAMAGRGAVWLDIRYPQQYESGSLPGAVNLPLTSLRVNFRTLSPEKTYIVCCDDPAASVVGALLLTERGYRASVLGEPVTRLVPATQASAARNDDGGEGAGQTARAHGDSREQQGEQNMSDHSGMGPGEPPPEKSASGEGTDSAEEEGTGKGDAPTSSADDARGPDKPVPVEEYAETITGKRLAKLVAQIRQEHDELTERGSGSDAAGSALGISRLTPAAEDLERRVDRLLQIDRGVIDRAARDGDAARGSTPESARSTSAGGTNAGGGTAFRAPPAHGASGSEARARGGAAEDDIARAFRKMEAVLRQQLDNRVAQERERFARQLQTRIDNVKRVASDQIREKLEAARQEYRTEYERRERVLNERYERLLELANRISAQKAELQKARKQLDAKLQAVGQLHRELDQLGQQVSNQIGDLAGLVSEDDGNPSTS